MAQHIIVTDYDQSWKEKFAKEAALIQKILGNNCVAVYHIGSTAVNRLAAKPIIDIMPVVHCLSDVAKVATEFEKIGYEYLGEFGIEGRCYLRKGGDERTHQIHIFEESDTYNIERHLSFRDYLNAHQDVCMQYAQLKKTLAKQFPYDIEQYCRGKDEFVKKIEADALQWKRHKKGL